MASRLSESLASVDPGDHGAVAESLIGLLQIFRFLRPHTQFGVAAGVFLDALEAGVPNSPPPPPASETPAGG
jgi:hypothetical protein